MSELTSSKRMFSRHQRSAIGITVLALSVLVILFSGSRGLQAEQVTTLMADFRQYITAQAQRQDRDVQFQHGTMVIEGWGYDKEAHIPDVSLKFSDKTPVGTQTTSYSTELMVIRKDNSVYDGFVVRFPDAINVISDSELVHIINGSAPIQMDVQQRGAGKDFISLRLPEQLRVTPASGAERQHSPARYELNLSGDNFISRQTNAADGSSQIQYQFPDIKVEHDGTRIFSATSIAGKYDIRKNKESRYYGNFELKGSDVLLPDAKDDRKLAMVLEGSYTAANITMDSMSLRPAFEDMALTLDKAALMGKDFSVMSSGQLAFSADDPLPHGVLEIEITNADNLVRDELVPLPLKPLLQAALKRASGTKGEFADLTSIPVKREKNGMMYLGGQTFEEITAAVLSDFLSSSIGQKKNDPAAVAEDLPPLPEGAPALEEMPSMIPVAPPEPSLLIPQESQEQHGQGAQQ
ncbi:MAG: hypothetical protein AB7L92_07925 [Alphaproteobacteria bacterium]